MAVMYAWKKLLLFMVVETSESWKLTLDELVENGNGKWFNCYSPFHISSALGIFRSSTQNQQCTSYWGSRQILSRQHAPNKLCALSNDVRLITQFYGTQLAHLKCLCWISQGLYKPYQALPCASMGTETVNFTGEHRWSTRLASHKNRQTSIFWVILSFVLLKPGQHNNNWSYYNNW